MFLFIWGNAQRVPLSFKRNSEERNIYTYRKYNRIIHFYQKIIIKKMQKFTSTGIFFDLLKYIYIMKIKNKIQ